MRAYLIEKLHERDGMGIGALSIVKSREICGVRDMVLGFNVDAVPARCG